MENHAQFSLSQANERIGIDLAGGDDVCSPGPGRTVPFLESRSLGLASERYDPIGRYHASDAKGPIDSSAVVTRLGPELDGPISGLPDLVTKLQTGRRVSDCAATNLAQFLLGRSVIETIRNLGYCYAPPAAA